MPLTERFTIIAFKAGRAFRREGTNIVEPHADKGAIVIVRGEDDLLHFMWKNRVTEETVEVFSSSIMSDSILADHILGSHCVPD
jgi:26S proteasome regulatory subunit N13